MSNNALLKRRYGNVVEGPQGLQMPEKVARIVEAAAKTLPKNDEHFNYRRRAFSAKQEDVDGGARTEVSTITTDAVDRDGECVLTSGGDWSSYNKVVPFCHKYDQLPAGISLWISPKGRATKAKTQYPPKPADWGDAAWMPSAIWAFINQPVPAMGDKSIGFLPLNVRGATPAEKAMRPELDRVPIIDKWLGLEYSCVLVPCNQEATLDAVISKGLSDGTITKDFADLVHRAMEDPKTLVSMTQGKSMDTPPADTATASPAQSEGANAMGGAVTPATVPQMKSMAHFKMPMHVQAGMKAMMSQIDPDDMADDAPDEHSMVMHHSMDTDDPAMVSKAIEGMGPMSCRMGKCKSMATKDMDGGDVDQLSMGISGKGLMPMHKALTTLPHSNPDAGNFMPRVKLCDLKPGMGAKYKDMDDMGGMGMKLKTLDFKDSKGNTTALPMTGGAGTMKELPTFDDGEPVKRSDLRRIVEALKAVGAPVNPANGGEDDMTAFCPQCMEEAKSAGTMDVPGIGMCDKYSCPTCKTDFLSPRSDTRSPEISGNTDGSPAGENVGAVTYGKGAAADPASVTASTAVAAPPAPVAKTVTPFVSPEDLARAIERKKAADKSTLAARMEPLIAEALDRRMGRV